MTIVINLIVSVLTIILLQVLGMVVFTLMTPFKDMDEIKKEIPLWRWRSAASFWLRRLSLA